MSELLESNLLERRTAYESLSNNLTQLPRKLTHAGLIPIAPRLYLPGELVRTNEILVLLGRSGEASYFAERTAWQAHQIVRRRLGHVEQGLKGLLAGAEQIHVTERSSSKPRKRVTFREPIVCASPPLKARPRPSSSPLPRASDRACDREGDAPFEPAESATIGRNAQSRSQRDHSTRHDYADTLQPRVQPTSVNHVPSVPQEYMDVLRAAELDEDSSDEDIPGEYGHSRSEGDIHFSSGPSAVERASVISAPPRHALESKIDMVSSELSAQNSSEDHEPGGGTKQESQGSTSETNNTSEQQSVKLEFQDALRNAEKQAEQDGVVNLMEFYEDDTDLPSHVDLPSNFRPDETIDFDDDAEQYLDMTGEAAKAARTIPSLPGNHLAFLQEEAQKEEEEERRKDVEKQLSDSDESRRKLEREKREFGTGFAKGFFGAPSKRNTASRQEDSGESPAPHVRDPEVSELQETGAVQDTVVERRTSRKTSRRQRKPKATVMPEVMSVAASQQESTAGEDERAGRFTRIEDVAEAEDTQVSKFRQLRKLKRASADVTNR